MDIKDLGLTKKEIQKRIVETICDRLLGSEVYDEDGESTTDLLRMLNKKIHERIDAKVTELGEKHVFPKVNELIENYVVQETTSWGEKKGEPKSFRQHLIDRADAWMREPVDYDGKIKEKGSYNWSVAGTRVGMLVHKYLHYEIENAMKEAFKKANESIAIGLHEAMKIKLDEIKNSIIIDVKTKK